MKGGSGMKLKIEKRQAVLWLLLLAFTAISLIYCLIYVENVAKFSESRSPDENNYIHMAERLLREGVYSYWGDGPDAFVSPGFPLFLTACFGVFGTGLWGIHCVKLVQAVLISLTVPLTFALGKQLTKKDSVGLIAAGLVALNGYFPTYSRVILTEPLYYFAMLLFFAVFVYAAKGQKLWLHGAAGLLFGVAVLVRPLVIITAPFLYLPLILSAKKQWKVYVYPMLCFLAGFVAVCLPWWIRNMATLHRFVFLATQTNPIYAGLAPDIEALGIENPHTMLGNVKLLFHLLFTRPLQTVYWMTFGKFKIIFMEPADTVYLSVCSRLLSDFTLYTGLLGCAGALFQKKYRLSALVFLVYFLSSFLFVPTSRYALQYFPFLAIFAGWVIAGVFAREKTALSSENS